MRTKLGLELAFGSVLALAACSRSPTAPDVSSLPTLVVHGPTHLAVGATAQFSVVTQFIGGATRDVTSGAVWSSSQPGVLSIDAKGRATGHSNGEALVRTKVGDSSSLPLAVVVLESGTYQVIGRVLRAGAPIGSATVEVVRGRGFGARTLTDEWGIYKLYGLAGQVELRASAMGFTPSTLSLVVTPDGSSIDADFDLQPAGQLEISLLRLP